MRYKTGRIKEKMLKVVAKSGEILRARGDTFQRSNAEFGNKKNNMKAKESISLKVT